MTLQVHKLFGGKALEFVGQVRQLHAHGAGKLRQALRTVQYLGVGPDRYHRRADSQRLAAPIRNHPAVSRNLGGAHRAHCALALQEFITLLYVQNLQQQNATHQQRQQRAQGDHHNIEAPRDHLARSRLHCVTTCRFSTAGGCIDNSDVATFSTR